MGVIWDPFFLLCKFEVLLVEILPRCAILFAGWHKVIRGDQKNNNINLN